MPKKYIHHIGEEQTVEDCEETLIELYIRKENGTISLDVYEKWVEIIEEKISEFEEEL